MEGSFRKAAMGVAMLFVALTSTASAHTWNLARDMPASADGVTAPANPFADSYADSGVWANGFGTGGTYSTSGGVAAYSGLTSFEVAPASDWSEAAGGTPGVEAWTENGPGNYPYVGVNHTESGVFVYPPGGVFMHPLPDEYEVPRAAVRWVSPVTGTVSIQSAFTDLDCGGGDGSDFSVESQEAGSSTFTHLAGHALGFCGSGSFESGPVSVKAGDSYYFSVGDGGAGSFGYDTTGVSVTITDGAPEPLTISVPSTPTTTTYKHAITPATISAADTDGDAVTLSAANVPAGLTFSPSTGVLSGAPTVPAGRYTITFSANDGRGETVTAPMTVVVEKGTCTLTPTAAVLGTTKAVSPASKLTEAGTKTAVVGRSVEFVLASLGAEAFSGPFYAKTGSTGVAKAKLAMPADVYLTGSAFAGDADFNACNATGQEMVTVTPATYNATAAGTILVGKTTVQLGVNATQGTELTGELAVLEGGNTFLVHHMTTSTLTKEGTGIVTLSGTGEWDGDATIPYGYTLTLVDPGTGADTASLTITSGETTLFSSGGAKAVKGGDAKVH